MAPGRAYNIKISKEIGSLIFIIAGIAVIVKPELIAWVVGIALILKGLIDLASVIS